MINRIPSSRSAPLAAICAIAFFSTPLAAHAQLARALAHGATSLGRLPASTPLHATVWLALPNKPALDQAVQAMYTLGSPSYHRFQTPSALKQYAPSPAQVQAVRAELVAHHLTVLGADANSFSLRITGQSSDVEAAFHTTIQQYRTHDGTVVRSLAAPPALGNAAVGLVRAVSGISGAGMQPFFRVPVDPVTGAQLGLRPVAPGVEQAGATPAGSVYSSGCIYPAQTVTLKTPTGAPPIAQYSGLVYGASPLNTQRGTIGPCGYSPQDVSKFYGLNLAYDQGYTGAGQSIAIIDAYGSPTLQQDYAVFNKVYGLTAATSQNFQVLAPVPVTGSDPGWAQETTLDVEWAHAIAPDATIKLITTPSNSDADLQAGVLYALDNQLASVISNSYGQGELASDTDAITSWNEVCELAAFEGVSVNFATGDVGDYVAAEGMADVSLPATSPYATAVGGTTTVFSPADGSIAQTGWGNNLTLLGTSSGPSDPPTQYGFRFGSGGGTSSAFAQPAYQSVLHGTGRQIPDVSALADPYTGVEILITVSGTQYYAVIGGTSLATPIFSGQWALLNQKMGKSLGQAAPLLTLYANSVALTDVTPPSAQYAVQGGLQDAKGSTYYSSQSLMDPGNTGDFVSALYNDGRQNIYAISFGTDSSLPVTQGWDPVTGWGTLDMGGIFQALAPAH